MATGEVVNSFSCLSWLIFNHRQMSEYINNKEKTEETLRYHEDDLLPGGAGGLGDGYVCQVL